MLFGRLTMFFRGPLAMSLLREGNDGGNGGGGDGNGSGNQNGNGSGGDGSGNQSNQNNSGGGGSGARAPQTTFDADYVRDLRKEAADNRVAAREAVKELDATKTRLGEVEGKLKSLNTSAAIGKVITDAGVGTGYSDAVAKLIDLGKLELDADGNPNADKLKTEVESLKKQYPAMFGVARKPKADAGDTGNEPNSSGGMNSFIRRAAGRE